MSCIKFIHNIILTTIIDNIYEIILFLIDFFIVVHLLSSPYSNMKSLKNTAV